MQDGDEHLPRGEAGGDLRPLRLDADPVDEGLDDGQRDIRLDERHAHLAQGLGDVVVADAPLAAQVLHGPGKFLTQGVEHRMIIPWVILRSLFSWACWPFV